MEYFLPPTMLFLFLGVLMCSKCKSQYGKGGWDKDKEGNDEFCRLVHLYNVHVSNVLTFIHIYIHLQVVF